MQDALTLEQLVATYQRRYDDALLGDLVNARQVYERLLAHEISLERIEDPKLRQLAQGNGPSNGQRLVLERANPSGEGIDPSDD